jgi:hypothetical protein
LFSWSIENSHAHTLVEVFFIELTCNFLMIFLQICLKYCKNYSLIKLSSHRIHDFQYETSSWVHKPNLHVKIGNNKIVKLVFKFTIYYQLSFYILTTYYQFDSIYPLFINLVPNVFVEWVKFYKIKVFLKIFIKLQTI